MMPKYHTLLLFAFPLLLAGCSSRRAAPVPPLPHYTVLDLGTLGGENGYGASINNQGQVVGRLGHSITDAQPFALIKGVTYKIGPLGGRMACSSQISDSGEVVGTLDPHGDISGKLTHAFVWQEGQLKRIDTPSIKVISAESVNREGDIVGMAQFSPQHENGFLRQRGKMIELVSSSAAGSFPMAINDASHVAGSSGSDAVVWLNGPYSVQRIGTGCARAINSKDQVVGNSGSTAFLWKNGVLTNLGLLGTSGNNQNSVAFSINDLGQIVGLSTPASRTAATKYNHAFLWQNGHMYDLNFLTPSSSPLEITVANAINNRGQVLCDAILNGKSHTVILTPTK